MKTNNKLASNIPIEYLDEENDFLETIPKAKAIQNFLEKDLEFFSGNKMIVIYGGWGSGKTTLMKYLQCNIDQKKFKTAFFEAWQHEKDENLGLSLADLLGSLVKDKEKVRKFLKGSARFLKGFAKGISIKFPNFSIPGFEPFSLDLKKSIEGIEKEIDKSQKTEKSFFQSLEDFKKGFREIENHILDDHGIDQSGKIIVFIDDLDRCEPENVLNLITAIKLFFTYGEKSIFICGIDKNAISKAVETRYKDVIKSDEYLEKVFDISFRMPKYDSLDKMISHYFEGQGIYKEKYGNSPISLSYSNLISEFLNSIGFTNPRHLKKVLNKYRILVNIKQRKEYPDLVPELIINGKGNITDTIFVLYFIILFEYFENQFNSMLQVEGKAYNYANAIMKFVDEVENNSNSSYIHLGYEQLLRRFSLGLNYIISEPIETYIEYILNEFKEETKLGIEINYHGDLQELPHIFFYGQFLPVSISELLVSRDIRYIITQFESCNQRLLIKFCLYLEKNFEKLANIDIKNYPKFSTIQLIKMAKTIL